MTIYHRVLGYALTLGVTSQLTAAEPPEISVSVTNNNLLLSWPATSLDWVLEETDLLQPPIAWRVARPATSGSETMNAASDFQLTHGDRFFRLRSASQTIPRPTGDWHLDEGTGDLVMNAIGVSGFFITNTEWTAGRVGLGALRFNGGPSGAGGSCAWVSNNDYTLLPAPGEPFSLSFWFNPETLPLGKSGLAGNDPTGSNGWRLVLHTLGPGTNLLEFASGAAQGISGKSLLLPGQWHSLTISHDGSEGAIYLNGERLAMGSFSLRTHDGPIYFGGGIAGYSSFHGRIDEVRTYSYSLPHEQISLAASWSFDEDTGNQTIDGSLNANHGWISSLNGGASGKNGSGLRLSAAHVWIANDFYTVLPPTGNPFSLSFWLKPETLQLGRNGLMSFGLETTNGWELSVDIDDQCSSSLHFCSTNRGGTLDMSVPLDWGTDEWIKIDLTHNGGIAEAYVNGRHAASAHGAIRSSRSPLWLGHVPGMPVLSGVIDELKIYHRVREPSEIGPVATPIWEMAFVGRSTNLFLQGSGPPGKPLTFSLLPSPSAIKGTAELDPTTGRLTYSAGLVKGPDVLAYVVSDGEFTSLPSTVTISVVQPHWLSIDGGAAEPQDGSSPLRAWATPTADVLDAIWRTNNYYDCFFYGPGTFQTRGWKYQQRSTANPGCKHIGSGNHGPNATTLQLVDIWAAWEEELIFGPGSYVAPCDGFEVHNLILDCNANNLPKFNRGEPVWVRVPLEKVGRVHSLTIHWNSSTIFHNEVRAIGPAAEFTVSAGLHGAVVFSTNCTITDPGRTVDAIPIGTDADQLFIELRRRAHGIEFYGINEIQVDGPAISLPTATSAGGAKTELNSEYTILASVDNDSSSAWVSGPDELVELEFPLPSGTRITELDLQWHCKTDPALGRFGPAAKTQIRARNELTGQFEPVPFVRHERLPAGWETSSFGSNQITNTITTDRVQILLSARETMVDHYGLREVRFRNKNQVVPVPIPSSLNTLNFAESRPLIRAFDDDYATSWASGTQGAVAAISLSGSNLKFTHLKVKGFGTKAGRECFAMYLISPRGNGGNVLVEDCLLSDPATNNTGGLTAMTLIQAPPATLTNAIIRRCNVLDVRSDFTFSQGFTAINVENCTVDGANIGAYFEPDSQTDDIGSVRIRNNQFLNVDYGVFVLFHPGREFDSLTCIGNEIVLTGQATGTGIACCDTCVPGMSGTVTNLTALNNIIRYPGWALRPTARDLGLYYSDIHHAVFGNNLLVQNGRSELRVRQYPVGTVTPPRPPEECDNFVVPPPGEPFDLPSVDILLPGYRRAWFNNRNLSGDLLPVRTLFYGADKLATDQQWSE